MIEHKMIKGSEVHSLPFLTEAVGKFGLNKKISVEFMKYS